MTISGMTSSVVYSTTAALLEYAFTFQILDETHLKVYKNWVLLTLTTDYTVTIVPATRMGHIDLVANPGDGANLVIKRATPPTQLTDYVEGDAFPAETHEEALDKLTMMGQDLVGGYPIVRFSDGDTTPDVSAGYGRFITLNTAPTTISMFDGGVIGQVIAVVFSDLFTTMDFTGTFLRGNGGVDWVPTSGDWMIAIFGGTYWRCAIFDCT